MPSSKNVKLTDGEMDHIIGSLRIMDMRGLSFGNVSHFRNRNKKIIDKLEKAIDGGKDANITET